MSWLDTVRGTTQEGVGKAPKAPEQNQMVDNGIVYALRKEIVVMSELVQKLMQEMRERRRERTLAELTKQNEQPQVPVSIPHAHTPASKKRAVEQPHDGGSESQIQVEIKGIKDMLCTTQTTNETLHATVLGLANRTTHLQGKLQMVMNHPIFTQHGHVMASSNAGLRCQ